MLCPQELKTNEETIDMGLVLGLSQSLVADGSHCVNPRGIEESPVSSVIPVLNVGASKSSPRLLPDLNVALE